MKSIKDNILIITIIICLLVTLSLPHIFRYLELGSKYTTLIINGPAATQTSWEETYTYATEANRIKNNQPINDPYIYEYRSKSSPLISEFAPSLLLGIPSKFLSIPYIFILIKIILIPAVVLIWYLIAREIGYSKIISVASALIGVILQKTFAYLPYINQLYSYQFSNYLEIQRTYFPLISSFSISISILLVIKLLKSDYEPFKKILAGIIFGSLFYTYFFAWTIFWMSFVILAVTLVLKKQFKILKRIVIPVVTATVIAAPYFVNLLLFSHNPDREDFILRTIGFPVTDWNLIVIIRFIILIYMLIVLNRSWLKVPAKFYLLIFLSSALFLSPLSKLILGADYQSDHWYERFLYPTSTFLFTLLIFDVLSKFKPKAKSFLALILILICLSKIVFVTVGEIGRPKANFRIGAGREDLYAWMLKNMPKNSVVATLSFTESVYLTAYTPYYSYLPQAYKTIAPKQEILDRYINLAQFYGVSNNFVTQPFIMPNEPYQNPNSIVAKDGNAYMMLTGILGHFDAYPFPFHKEIRSQILTKLSQTVPWQGRVDYALFGPLEQENSTNFSQRKCRSLYSNGEYQIFDIKTCKLSS